MIYTITCNPALDYLITLPELHLGEIQHTQGEILRCGGKGINVSVMLRQLGVSSTALGFLVGETGTLLHTLLRREGIATDFILVAGGGMTRINLKIHTKEGETEINGTSPSVSPWEQQQLLLRLERLREGDIAVLGGSLPQAVVENFYEKMIRRLQARGVICLVDTSGTMLQRVLPLRPFLVKPNHRELGEMLGLTMDSWEKIEQGARVLQQQGARMVLVSWEDKGAMMLTEEGETLFQPAPKGIVISSIGAGDALLAGWLAGMIKGFSWEKTMKLAVTAGSATAFSQGMAKKAIVEQIYPGTEEGKEESK